MVGSLLQLQIPLHHHHHLSSLLINRENQYLLCTLASLIKTFEETLGPAFHNADTLTYWCFACTPSKIIDYLHEKEVTNFFFYS